jgi:cytidylate kinase
MIKVLVIEREYGAGAGVISERIAGRLGWKLYDHALTEEIARQAKVNSDTCRKHEEKVDSWLYRLAKVFWRGSHERSVQLADSDVLDADRLICITQEVVERLAESGNCIIVGRAAAYFLRNRPDTFCVFLYAPRDYRFHRVLAEVKNEAEAIELVDKVDEERRQFIKHYFNADWPSRQLYHAMLNTAAGDDVTVETVLYLLEAANRRSTNATP